MINVMEHLSILGLPVEDRVTKYRGAVASVSFDLYGCVQALVHAGMDKDGKLVEQVWFDIGRLRITDETKVMDPPDFSSEPQSEVMKGPAEKPAFKA